MRLILFLLIAILLNACCQQDPFQNDYKVIGFNDGVAKTIAVNLNYKANLDELNQSKEGYLIDLNTKFAMKLMAYSAEYCALQDKCLLAFYPDKKNTPLHFNLTDNDINNMLVILAEDKTLEIRSILDNCQLMNFNGDDRDCITVPAVRKILAEFGYK